MLNRLLVLFLFVCLFAACGPTNSTVVDNQPATVAISTIPAATPVPSPTATEPEPTFIAISTIPVMRPAEDREPQPTLPTPTETAEPEPCASVGRPAILALDGAQNGFVLVDPAAGTSCHIPSQARFYPPEVQVVGDTILFSEFSCVGNSHALCVTARRFTLEGDTPTADLMGFATIPFVEGDALQGFAYSKDGNKVAWSALRHLEENEEAIRALATMWVANSDGSEMVQVLQQELTWLHPANPAPGPEAHSLLPLRFSPDGRTLFYTLDPQGLGGVWTAYLGLYDNLYAVEAEGGAPRQLFDCATVGVTRQLCVGDFFVNEDGTGVIAYADRAHTRLNLIDLAGQHVNSYAAYPGADYVGYPVFNGRGDLAFFAATLQTENRLFSHAQINLVRAPYQEPATILVSGDNVFMSPGWLDNEHLIYEDVNLPGLALVATAGDSATPQPLAQKQLYFVAVMPSNWPTAKP